MKKHWQYLKYVLKHKWYTFLECCKLGVPWLGIIHDWSKFLPSEWFACVNYFHGPQAIPRRDVTGYYKPTDTGDLAFDFARFLHDKRNRHSWQWWTLPNDKNGIEVFPIPDKYRREMLADWRGAGRAQGTPNTASWYCANSEKMQLHPETRAWIEERLGVMYTLPGIIRGLDLSAFSEGDDIYLSQENPGQLVSLPERLREDKRAK